MRRFLAIYLFCMFSFSMDLSSQDNCNVYLSNGDSCRYAACHYLEKAPSYFQLTKEYHVIKDKAIALCPEYSLPYKHKSTAYLKTGDFIGFKRLIDKAVELNPELNLNYRGWCRFQFFRDYQGAIDDIERLDELLSYDIGYCQNGYYHLNIAKGLCYKMLGKREKAIEIIEKQIQKNPSDVGLFDYLHLGVLYLETGQYEKAKENFEKQENENELAENCYYQGLLAKAIGQDDQALSYLQKAKKLYEEQTYMFDVYTHQVDKIFLGDIQEEIEKL